MLQAAKKPLFPYDESAMLPNHVMLDLKVSGDGLSPVFYDSGMWIVAFIV